MLISNISSPKYSPYIPVTSAERVLSEVFADAIFDCPQCSNTSSFSSSSGSGSSGSSNVMPLPTTTLGTPINASVPSSRTIFFNGTLWVADSRSLGTSHYPYILSNIAIAAQPMLQLLGPGCPRNMQALTAGGITKISQEYAAQQYLNLLSNSIVDPSLRVYTVQGGVSSYGMLFFNLQAVSQFISFFLSIFTILLFNSLWPLSVWRLVYEVNE